MDKIGKTFALFLTLIIAMSSLTFLSVKPASAQSIPKPSVPEFTIRIVSHPYDIPQATTIDPYTGKTEITREATHVENKSIEVTIRNQDYAYVANGTDYWIVLNVRTKGHFGDYWTELFRFDKYVEFNKMPRQSSGQYTIINIPADDYPPDSQMDIQVQAYPEYDTQFMVYPHFYGPGELTWGYGLAEGSGWSNIQTIKVTDGSVSSTTPNPSPTVPEFPFVAVLSLLVVIPLITVLAKKRICLKVYN